MAWELITAAELPAGVVFHEPPELVGRGVRFGCWGGVCYLELENFGPISQGGNEYHKRPWNELTSTFEPWEREPTFKEEEPAGVELELVAEEMQEEMRKEVDSTITAYPTFHPGQTVYDALDGVPIIVTRYSGSSESEFLGTMLDSELTLPYHKESVTTARPEERPTLVPGAEETNGQGVKAKKAPKVVLPKKASSPRAPRSPNGTRKKVQAYSLSAGAIEACKELAKAAGMSPSQYLDNVLLKSKQLLTIGADKV